MTMIVAAGSRPIKKKNKKNNYNISNDVIFL